MEIGNAKRNVNVSAEEPAFSNRKTGKIRKNSINQNISRRTISNNHENDRRNEKDAKNKRLSWKLSNNKRSINLVWQN